MKPRTIDLYIVEDDDRSSFTLRMERGIPHIRCSIDPDNLIYKPHMQAESKQAEAMTICPSERTVEYKEFICEQIKEALAKVGITCRVISKGKSKQRDGSKERTD